MTLIGAKPEVLKQDARGRVQTPPQRREALLDEFEGSGLSAAKFARLTGINYATFTGCTHQRRKARSAAPKPARSEGKACGPAEVIMNAAPLRLLEAVVEGKAPCKEERKRGASAGLCIELPGGSRMLVDSPAQLPMAAELVTLIARSLR